MKLLIMGPPGAGKGTQAKILSSKFNLIHLSTGDILRSEISKGSSTGIEAQSYMNAGNLVPDKVLLAMMETTLENFKDNGLILDKSICIEFEKKTRDKNYLFSSSFAH